jgi:hypothetical protein
MNYGYRIKKSEENYENGFEISSDISRKQSQGETFFQEKENFNYNEIVSNYDDYQRKSSRKGSENIGYKGISGCSSCGGAGYLVNTDGYGRHKTCPSCEEITSHKFLLRNRGYLGCHHCGGDGFLKQGSDVVACSRCLKLTGYCSTCLDTGYKIGTTKSCDHRRT